MNAPTPAGALALPSIPLADIAPSPTNPRKHFDQAALAELAATIKDHGVIQPITVRPYPADRVPAPDPTEAWPFKDPSERKRPTYEIVVGERRWRASRMAGLAEIPAFWRELTDQQVLEIQIIENLQRNDVHPLEEAEGYRQLMDDHGYTVEQIAAKIGKELEKKSYVYARLKLLDLCQEARNIMYERKLDASTALLVARIPAPGLQKQALKQIAPEGSEPLSYRAAKNHIRNHFTISLKHATFSLTDASLVEAAGSCQDCPKRSGNAPELFGDTDDADVCSDTKCFDAKKAAKHQALIDTAEFNNIPVLRGDDAKAVMPWGRSSIDNDKYIDLDDWAEGDAEERTYREILGDAAPVSALIEATGHDKGKLIEVAEPTALAEALQKAGWKPQEQPEENTGAATTNTPTVRAITPEQIEAERKEREAKDRAYKIESLWRERLIETCLASLPDILFEQDTIEDALKIFAGQWADMDAEFNGFNETLAQKFGHQVANEYDPEDEASRLAEAMKQWDISKIFSWLFYSIINDRNEKSAQYSIVAGFPVPDAPKTTLALAGFLGIDPGRIRDQVTAEFDGPGETEIPDSAEPDSNGIKIGDRVRIKNDVRAPNGNRRKCCGREGTVESSENDGAYYTVRFSPKKTDIAANLTWNEFDVITESTPQGLAETVHTPNLAAPAAGTGGEEDGLEARPNVRYALWGSAGWVTWSGKGKKPAWVEQWLANGKKLEDLEAKADPAPAAQANEKPTSASTGDDSDDQGQDPAQAAPGNESPAATGADSTNGDLFGQAGGNWPKSNEHGVYAADQAERIAIDTKKAKVEGYVLQIGPDAWAWVVDTQRKGENYEGHSSPITAHQVAHTRSDAISDIGAYTSQRVCSWIDNDGPNADFKRIKNWADDLLVNGEKAPCLDQNPAAKKEAKALKPVDAWPFPTGSRP